MKTKKGIKTTIDGSGAVVWVESHICEGACSYPITSSTPMGVGFQALVAQGAKNLWGTPLAFYEPESEHSSASVAEGFGLAGKRVVNFTSGQGLILMKEVLYPIAGKRIPAVFHVGARALTVQSLNVHCGHDDVMGVKDTNWGIVFCKNVQEVADLSLIVRRVAEDSETPFLCVQDGFLTTHTLETAYLPEKEWMEAFVGPPDKLRNFMDPYHPLMSGVVQNQDSYMKGHIAQRYFYERVENFFLSACKEYEKYSGRAYGPIAPYRTEDADIIFVCMGTLVDTAEATVDWLRKEGVKAGVIGVTLYRPFPGPQLVAEARRAQALCVLERTDEPLAPSNPLTSDIKTAFCDAFTGARYPSLYPAIERIPLIYSASCGLGGRDVCPADFIAAAEFIRDLPAQRYFVLGIKHELALERKKFPDLRPEGAFSMRGHSVGGFGSVTTNKIIATVVGDLFKLYVQAFPKYGSEKKGLPTTYYLTAAPEPVRVHAELSSVEFVSLNDVNAFYLGNPLAGISQGGTLFLQTPDTDPARVWEKIPEYARRIIMEKQLRVLFLDTQKIAKETAPRPDLEMRMQGIVLLGIFLKAFPHLTKTVSQEELVRAIESSLKKYFGKKGKEVLNANMVAVMRGYKEVSEIPQEIKREIVHA